MAKQDTSLDDIATAIGDLATHMDERFEHVNQRLDGHDQQFVSIAERFDEVDKRFDEVDLRFNSVDAEFRTVRQEQKEMREWLERIDSKILGVGSDIKEIYDRIVILEKKGPYLTRKEANELEQKLARMIDWAKKVSQKTGIALPKL